MIGEACESWIRGRRYQWMLVVIAGVLLTLLGQAVAVQAITILQIDPRATYFRTYEDPDALDAVALDLGLLGFRSGDVMRFTRLGDFDCSFGTCPFGFDSTIGMGGVFSASTFLLGSDQLNRVVGAIDAGPELDTLHKTLFGGFPLDISEDFAINGDGVVVPVPVGARYLFIGAYDIFFGDNRDPDGDFALQIARVTPMPIPEPGTVVLLGSGLAGLLAWRKTRA